MTERIAWGNLTALMAHEAEVDRIVRMTAAEVDAELRAHGLDPAEVEDSLRARLDAVLEACGAQSPEEAA